MGRRRKPKFFKNVQITGVADKGKGVGRNEEGQVVFVKGAVVGDVVEVLQTKKRSKYIEGRIINYESYSEDRIEPKCAHFGKCGGCNYQSVPYETQLGYKQDLVENAIQRIGKIEPKAFPHILPCEKTFFYRNKMEFTFSSKKWLEAEELNNPEISNKEDVLGFHPAGYYNKILDVEKCWLQEDPSNGIRLKSKALAKKYGMSFFDADAFEGFIRTMIVRITSTGEIMLIYMFFENDMEKIKPFMDDLLEAYPTITSLNYSINKKRNNSIYDLDIINYHGKDYITEQLGDVSFKVGPKSFFQTNSHQAKELYDKVVEFAGLDGTQNVYDLYTGVGSIALYVAKYAKSVVGIEEVASAIEDAKENMRLNGIENCRFYAGDVKNILTDEFAKEHGRPDLVITDPPRAGMHPSVVEMFLKLESERIVYVSCNPSTQARDLQVLSEKYEVEKVQAVDMFPQTYHVESIALLKLKTASSDTM